MKKHIYAIASVMLTVFCLMSGTLYANETLAEPEVPTALEEGFANGNAGEEQSLSFDTSSLASAPDDTFTEDGSGNLFTEDGQEDPQFSDGEELLEDTEFIEWVPSEEMIADELFVEDDEAEAEQLFFDDITDGISEEDGIEEETETVDPELEETASVIEEAEIEEESSILASGITINTEEVTLYYLSAYYPEYISSIPDGMPVSFRIEVSGTDKKPEFVRSGSGINVDDTGLITLDNDSHIVHETPGYIKVKIDGKEVARVTVNQIAYERYYAEQKVNADMERLGIKGLGSDYEKVKAICEYISGTYNYSPKSASMTGEVITGGADCWGNSDMVSYMCEQCGIPAFIRNANYEPGAGAGHENNIVKADGEYYIVDCGYTGNAPRHYDFYKVNNDFEYFYNDDGTIRLVSYMRFDSDVITIPAQIDGHKVSSIRTGMLQEREYSRILVEEGSEYFSSRNNALCSADGKTLIACPRKTTGSYTIPDGVETVGQYAFTYCEDIEEVTMPDTLTTIEYAAFRWCKSMSVVNWSNSLTTIGEDAFTACQSLKTIVFPESLRTIGASSFCASMQPRFVYIPSGVTSVGERAFLNVPFMVVRARDPELGENAIAQCRLFCYPGSTVDTTCSGTHFDIGLLDENNKLVLKKDFFTVDLSDQTYTGSPLTVSVNNTDDYKWLRIYDWTWVEEQDRYVYGITSDYYDITYENNVNAGTATVYISGKGHCTGTISYTFRINPKSVFASDYYSCRMMFKDTDWRTASYAYTGEEIRPEIILKRYGETVSTYLPGRDYTLTYSDNTEIGYETGTVTLNGIGNYAGTDTLHFTIKGQLPEPEAIPDQQYTGSNITPEVSIPGLTEDTDYYTYFSDNYRPGLATVTIVGMGCYEGTRTLSFPIYRELPAIYNSIPEQRYTGEEIRPYIYIPGATEWTDYTLTYSDNIEEGTATVTATGIGYYTGTQTAAFSIKKAATSSTYWNDYYDWWVNSEDDSDDDSVGSQAATISLNAYSIPLRVGQTTRKIKVSGLQKGDTVRSWSSSNAKIVTVNRNGVIRALKKTGTAYVTVRTEYGASATVKVKVQRKKVAAKKILVKKNITLKKGEKYSLDALVTPITTPDRLKYKSAVKAIATVSGKGMITAKAKGQTTITITCGKKKARIRVRVN